MSLSVRQITPNDVALMETLLATFGDAFDMWIHTQGIGQAQVTCGDYSAVTISSRSRPQRMTRSSVASRPTNLDSSSRSAVRSTSMTWLSQ
jgi:hypothetical protein